MNFHKFRLMRLEGKHRRRVAISYFLSVVHVPWDLDEPGAYWRRVRCPCGLRACHQLQIGALIPETAPSDAAWAARRRDA
jgi:hypothetical protein